MHKGDWERREEGAATNIKMQDSLGSRTGREGEKFLIYTGPEGKPGGESRFPLSLKTDGVFNTKLSLKKKKKWARMIAAGWLRSTARQPSPQGRRA